MRVFILWLFPMLVMAQPIQRNFFTTNPAPLLTVTAGTNAFVTYTTFAQGRDFKVDVPTMVGQTNNTIVIAGTNATVVTNVVGANTTYTVSAIPDGTQTNLALVVAGTNVFVGKSTNSGVTTFTIDVPSQVNTNGFVRTNDTRILAFAGPIYDTNLTASRVVLTDADKGLSSAAASGAVPIDADGSATTATQINALFPGFILTNNWSVVARGSNDLRLDATHALSLSNATVSRVLMLNSDNTVTNVSGTGPINGDGTQAVLAAAFPAALTNNDTRNVDIKGTLISTNDALPSVGYTLYRQTTNVIVTQTSSTSNIFSFTLPANALGTNKVMHVRLWGDYVQNAGTATNLTWVVKYGSTTNWGSAIQVNANATTRQWNMMLDFYNVNGNTASQKLNGFIWASSGGNGTVAGSGVIGTSLIWYGICQGTSSEASTTALTFSVIFNWQSAANTVALNCNEGVAIIE